VVSDLPGVETEGGETTMTEVRVKARQPRPIIKKKVKVEAAGINSPGYSPTRNLLVVNVTDSDGEPVTGLTEDAFTLVNYDLQAHAFLRVVDWFMALSEELPDAGIEGVYRFSAHAEPELVRKVGTTAYAVKLLKTVDAGGHLTEFSGQTVVSVVMQRVPQ
jgi:hypothetical protein